eukprot:CAMPEP_0206394192 /NCGR_PEP_ID=MMETSP0294-20121207/21213_1 /ASSEMBLY_ACC=CAM_ASM_000327 /TAXON_ID=39354 /ORGANISM="Heterosigma akashiwo, Strain CCMP2393" /LENGTH=612 /DNA_ID=CAMNT_0053848025 /DNA_START=1 /DNA_END=1840 /DNA_ORIENTATION=+
MMREAEKGGLASDSEERKEDSGSQSSEDSGAMSGNSSSDEESDDDRRHGDEEDEEESDNEETNVEGNEELVEHEDEEDDLVYLNQARDASSLIALLIGGGTAAGMRTSQHGQNIRRAEPVKFSKENSAVKQKISDDCSYNPQPWGPSPKRVRTNTADMLHARRIGLPFKRKARANLFHRFLPSAFAKPLRVYPEQLFCGQFSEDGEVFLSACQDAVIRLYRAPDLVQWAAQGKNSITSPHEIRIDDRRRGYARREDNGPGPRPFRQVACRDISWSVISTSFSPDRRWLAYSSWSPYVHLANVFGEYERHEACDFEPPRGHFCLFSIEFSPCSTMIAGGASDNHVYLYNLERKTVVSRAPAHQDDVNAVKYADARGHLLFSGSDDGLVKVWDTRSLRRAAGSLVGHRGGITYIDSKGDGHHLLSNSKDQSIKLWDIRAMQDPVQAQPIRQIDFDYRWQAPRRGGGGGGRAPLPGDTRDRSVATFTGHHVMRTLIRCHFSPVETTAQRYVISGSGDGNIVIWDILNAEVAAEMAWHRECVRDVAWHPHRPLIASSSWDHSVGLWTYREEENAPLAAGYLETTQQQQLLPPMMQPKEEETKQTVNNAGDDEFFYK